MAEEKTNAKRGNVTYVSSAELLKECDRIPVIKERVSSRAICPEFQAIVMDGIHFHRHPWFIA